MTISGQQNRLPNADSTGRGNGCAVVKLGGGLITFDDKGLPVTNRTLITACAQDLATSAMPIVLVHGTGTYGKPPAIRYNYLNGRLSSDQSDIVAQVAVDLARLELDVLECLQSTGLRPMRLSLLPLFRAEKDRVTLRSIDSVADLLARGITPVVGGNFIVDPDGFAIFSSDNVAVELAIALNAAVLILATNACGVYRKYGQSEAIYKVLSENDHKKLSTIDEGHNDVSGGIKSKIMIGFHAAKDSIPTFIVDGRLTGNLSSALACHPKSGTRLVCDAASLSS